MGHKLIRRVSLDQFYALVTGQHDAFYQICMVLPEVIETAVADLDEVTTPNDTVFDELLNVSKEQSHSNEDLNIAMSAYMLGFSSYNGFK